MMLVLYVDDNPDALKSGKKRLEVSGDIAVDTALSAHTALEMLRQKSYDSIVSDFQLPDMDGMLFLKEIQKNVPVLPVIFFSCENATDPAHGNRIYPEIPDQKKSEENTSRYDGLYRTLLEMKKEYREKKQYRQIIENAREGVLLVREGVIIYTNSSVRRSLGASAREEMEGHRLMEFVPAEDHKMIPLLLQERSGETGPEEEITFRALTRYGLFRLFVCTRLCIDWDGRPATLLYLSDITEQKMAENAFVLVNKKIRILNELTRHDIANRLTVLRGRLKRSRNAVTDPEVIRHLDEVDTAGKEIFSHLEMARMYQELGKLSPQWFNLGSLLDVVMIRAEVPELKLLIETNNIEIYADPLCPRVFENLIDNSLRHGNNVSEIRITTRVADNCLVITLEDNGSGILAEDKERIFEQGVGKHTGLGLFLSREILSITDITIRETGSPGSGARFEIAVPRRVYRHSRHRQQTGLSCT
ncbi:response regulator [Methanoregula sp.]|uniref:response regulator n=1 Tax=Methanoregula sp. TaxID=2052170 RepID=UPI003565AB23